ncbi:exodeoxyribonuclease V subunit beta [Spectribacter hydrogenoxidans]|uniref:RecBCD enzyme subunit RecB n=1 Tax=Spectribacter hydrogenoxidans TaxID=3075608 RepID=A0ABU3BZZ4_9GAMM|nr:exodeoxyribonuclease V subunit beta [Salinisphaera sp. W335]MDT0634892.1 exodeoxyribonuclease V subunit beta [Salinisphaera sp. W335]
MSRQPFDPQTMPLDGIRLVEASAGTGKTFSLAGLYLRLLVEKKLCVRDILVMTFTRAATKELRERIRQRLVAAARIAGDPDAADPGRPDDAFAEAVITASGERRVDLARRLAEAAHCIDEATITTIHGFSQRAATDNAFDSALPFDRGEQVDDKLIYEEAIADYWRNRALGDNPDLGFVDWWSTPDDLDECLRDFRTRPHAQLAGPSNTEIEKAARELRETWTDDGKAFIDELRICWHDGVFKKQGLKKAIEHLGGIDEAIELLERALTKPAAIPGLPDGVAYLNDPDTEVMKRHLERGTALFDRPLARQLSRMQPLGRLAALREARDAVHSTARARKRQHRQYSFADMIEALHAAVTDATTGPRLADAMHATWPWALVDEFQDTDPLQYAILQRVYAGRESGGLILIGDPKQAIFGFRGGDVYAYLDAAADAGGHTYSLDTNFRSTQAVLDGIEALFRMPGEDSFLVEGIDYQGVQAGRPGQRQLVTNGTTQPAITLWHLAMEAPTKGVATNACQAACVGQIQRLLDREHGGMIRTRSVEQETFEQRAVAPRDIAVLVNTNRQAGDMQRALSAVGIPAVCLHRDSVFASEEARDVLHVLKAAASPTDEGVMRGALTGALLGYRLGDVIALADDEHHWQAATGRFQQAHEAWRDHGVLAMLQPLVQAGAEHLLTYLDGERRMSNYLQLAELLAEAESETFGMTGLLRWLREAIRQAGEPGGDDAAQLRLESDEALVRIATVHKAKGLEYPVVFLPFAPWLGVPPPQASPDQPPHQFHDDERRALVDVAGSDEAREGAIRETRAEGLRLLYVALTRAEIACFFPWGAANGTPDSALASLLHREDIAPTYWGGQKKSPPLDDARVRQQLETLAQRAPHAIGIPALPHDSGPPARMPTPAGEPGRARSDLPDPRPPWSVYSFTRLVHAAGPDRAMPGAEDEIDTDTTESEADATPLPELPGGTAFGSAVHSLLENAEPAAWPPPGGDIPAGHRNWVEWTLRRYGVALPDGAAGDAAVDATATMVQTGLYTPLPRIGPLAELPRQACLAEMEFVMRLNGQSLGALLDVLDAAGYARQLPRERQAELLRGLMHGFIDLVVEHDDRYYVLDHKTNYLGPNAEDYHGPALQAAVQRRHYDLQYLIYVTALHRFLRQRLADYDPETHLGGVLYLFLRGMAPDAGKRGIFFHRPDAGLIERLDDLLDQPEVAA